MNNLTQTQQEAKQAYLNRQQDQMLATYQKASQTERIAVIKHIDSFLEIVTKDEKSFWLKFRQKLERLNEQLTEIKFPLGKVFVTYGASEALKESMQLPNEFLSKHQKGEWGIVGNEDWKENEFSLKNGFRILSAYKTVICEKIWIITEADRSSTTILLPEEY